jgi:hypothetical protein
VAENAEVDRGDAFVPPTVDEIVKNEDTGVIGLDKKDVKAEDTPAKAGEEPKKEEKIEKTVPLARMNEAVAKERARLEAATARTRELEGKLEAQTTSKDIDVAQKTVRELIKTRNGHLSEGKIDEASAVDEKIIELQEAIADRKAEIKLAETRTSAIEEVKYDAIVERLEADHPELNPDADEFDEEVALEVRALMRGYQSELRLSPSAALQRAAKKVFGATPRAAAKEVKEDKSAEEGLRRKTEATERNIEAAKKQPASSKDIGLDHDKKGGGLDAKTIMSMRYDEFTKIGDDVLAKLRGDSL